MSAGSGMRAGRVARRGRLGRANLFGIVSICFGIPALLAAIAVKQAERLRQPGVGYLLNWMDALGLVREPDPNQVPEWRPLGALDLTDDLAVLGLLVYSVCFSIWAMLIALWACYRRETTLALSIGFIMGVLSLHLYGFQYSMSALLFGALGKAVIRYRQRPNRPEERKSCVEPEAVSC